MSNKICDTFVYDTCICCHEPEIYVAHVDLSGAKMYGGED